MFMQRIITFTIVLLLSLVAVPSSFAQERGEGRITGKVIDIKGQPVADVTVRATRAGDPTPVQTKSDKKGEFTLANLVEGDWTLEFTKDGFQPQRGSLKLGEGSSSQKVDVTLAEQQADPSVELQAEAKKGEALMKAGQYAEARKVYEDLLAKYPTVHQIHRLIAASYASEKNHVKAVEHMRILVEKEPDNIEHKTLLADLLIEEGGKDEALSILRGVDLQQAKDPYPFINGAIMLIRDGKTDEAITMLTSLAERFPTQADIYYYRGRAYIAAKKLPEAKADLEKFVATAPPDARELAEAKNILAQIKDVK